MCTEHFTWAKPVANPALVPSTHRDRRRVGVAHPPTDKHGHGIHVTLGAAASLSAWSWSLVSVDASGTPPPPHPSPAPRPHAPLPCWSVHPARRRYETALLPPRRRPRPRLLTSPTPHPLFSRTATYSAQPPLAPSASASRPVPRRADCELSQLSYIQCVRFSALLLLVPLLVVLVCYTALLVAWYPAPTFAERSTPSEY